jgi:hypothetical protein
MRKENRFNRSLLLKGVVVFAATIVSDFVWAKYMASVAGGTPLVAANWSVLIIAIGAYLVVSYVDDKRLIVPACMGAWLGTYLAV